MRTVCVSRNALADKNKGNVLELTPFFVDIDGTMHVTPTFHDEIQGHVLTSLQKSGLVKISVTLTPQTYTKELLQNPEVDKFYWTVYRAYCEWYNASHWWVCLPHTAHVELTDEERQYLAVGKACLFKCHMLDRITDKISDGMKSIHSAEFFIKTTAQSPKHDFAVRSVENPLDALQYLLPSPTIVRILNRDEPAGFLISPWKPSINHGNEIRAFVINTEVVGISQQYLYEEAICMPYIAAQAESIREKIEEFWKWSKQHHKYTNAVLDMYVDMDDEMDDNYSVHLIEINPGSGWSPGASSLFTWQELYALHAKNECEFRYLSG